MAIAWERVETGPVQVPGSSPALGDAALGDPAGRHCFWETVHPIRGGACSGVNLLRGKTYQEDLYTPTYWGASSLKPQSGPDLGGKVGAALRRSAVIHRSSTASPKEGPLIVRTPLGGLSGPARGKPRRVSGPVRSCAQRSPHAEVHSPVSSQALAGGALRAPAWFPVWWPPYHPDQRRFASGALP